MSEDSLLIEDVLRHVEAIGGQLAEVEEAQTGGGEEPEDLGLSEETANAATEALGAEDQAET